MDVGLVHGVRDDLERRRGRLAAALRATGEGNALADLLAEVDDALARLDAGTYGICQVCQGEIEPELLRSDPLARVCLEDLSAGQRRALERDLDLAGAIQRQLLPARELAHGEWRVAHHYRPAGPVSGDYLDVVPVCSGDGLLLALGDVSGKGVAASMLMTHLAAIFRSLAELDLPLVELVERANRLFCQGTPSAQFATMVCARAQAGGGLELVNAGHMTPLRVHAGGVSAVAGAGLPLGLFCATSHRAVAVDLAPGDSLVLWTDGLTECRDALDQEYGVERLDRVLAGCFDLEPPALISACLEDLASFRDLPGPLDDDLTVVVLRRAGGPARPA